MAMLYVSTSSDTGMCAQNINSLIKCCLDVNLIGSMVQLLKPWVLHTTTMKDRYVPRVHCVCTSWPSTMPPILSSYFTHCHLWLRQDPPQLQPQHQFTGPNIFPARRLPTLMSPHVMCACFFADSLPIRSFWSHSDRSWLLCSAL